MKSRAECCDALAETLREWGVDVLYHGPRSKRTSSAIKRLAACTAERDAKLRKSALAALMVVLEQEGARFWQLLGDDLPSTQADLIKERAKFVELDMKKRGVSPGTTVCSPPPPPKLFASLLFYCLLLESDMSYSSTGQPHNHTARMACLLLCCGEWLACFSVHHNDRPIELCLLLQLPTKASPRGASKAVLATNRPGSSSPRRENGAAAHREEQHRGLPMVAAPNPVGPYPHAEPIGGQLSPFAGQGQHGHVFATGGVHTHHSPVCIVPFPSQCMVWAAPLCVYQQASAPVV